MGSATRHPSFGTLGDNSYVAAAVSFALLCVCVHAIATIRFKHTCYLRLCIVYIFRQSGAGYNLQSSTCGVVASGNSIVFDSMTNRFLVTIANLCCTLIKNLF